MQSDFDFLCKLRRKLFPRVLLIPALILAFSTEASAGEYDVSDAEFLTFNLANPELDAAKALANKQSHCYGVNGYTRSFPGITSAADVKLCAEIERNIAGTSDYAMPEHEAVQRAATPYATRFNRYIVAH